MSIYVISCILLEYWLYAIMNLEAMTNDLKQLIKDK